MGRASAPTQGPQKARLPASVARLAPYASIVLGIMAIVLLWAGTFVHMARERAQDERAALQNANNLVRLFEEQVIRSLRAADQALLYFRDSYESNGGQIDAALWLRPYRSLDDFVFQIAVIDRNGALVASNIEGSEVVNISDREHFRVHAEGRKDDVFISKPVVGRVSGRLSIQLTRRIRAKDGSFGGVMVLSIDPDYFIRFYESIDLGPRGSITLIGTDGIVRAHGANERLPVGSSVARERLLSEFAREKAGTYVANGRTDGVERFVTYSAVRGYPLIVSVERATDDILARFHESRLLYILALCALTAVLVPLALLIVWYERGLARARDAAEAGTRARSDFLAMMSHEIRTPMNAVLGFASALLEGKLDPEQRRAATALHAAGDNLLRILNDILDFARLESGRIAFEALAFSPAGVAESAVGIAAPCATAKGLALRVETDPDLPSALEGDAGRLCQVLLNLLTNAVKFTQRGEVVVAVRCLARSADRATVQWSVTDTGIGIAANRIDAMFEDFVQADNSVSRRFGGSGLGLAICRRIVDQMNGTIEVRSTEGQGSTFAVTVTLPLAELPAEAPAGGDTAEALRARIAALGRPLRILLAEDNPTNQLVCRALLRDFDIGVSVASNGAQAVRALGESRFDLVLMDVQMPEMNGIEATRAIRKAGSAVPIVALTANAYPEDVKACFDAGMNGFVAKPVRKAVLAEAIARALGDAPQVAPFTAPQAEDAAAPLVEREILDEFVAEVGIEPVRAMMRTFLGEAARRLGILRAASIADREAIHFEAHTLKGSSGIFGLMRLSALAGRLERQSATIGPQAYDAAVAELLDVFAASRRELDALLAPAPA